MPELCVRACICVCACVRARSRVSVCVCVRARAYVLCSCVRACVRVGTHTSRRAAVHFTLPISIFHTEFQSTSYHLPQARHRRRH